MKRIFAELVASSFLLGALALLLLLALPPKMAAGFISTHTSIEHLPSLALFFSELSMNVSQLVGL